MEEVEKQPKTIVIPRYQPVFVEPNLKEYETQVLQMSVTMADDSEQTRHMDQMVRNLRYQPSFSMDNISYITKDKAGNLLLHCCVKKCTRGLFYALLHILNEYDL